MTWELFTLSFVVQMRPRLLVVKMCRHRMGCFQELAWCPVGSGARQKPFPTSGDRGRMPLRIGWDLHRGPLIVPRAGHVAANRLEGIHPC